MHSFSLGQTENPFLPETCRVPLHIPQADRNLLLHNGPWNYVLLGNNHDCWLSLS